MKTLQVLSYLLLFLCCGASLAASQSEAGHIFRRSTFGFPYWNNGMPLWTGYMVRPRLIHPRVPAAPERPYCWYRLDRCVYSVFQFFYGTIPALSPECCSRVRTIGDECAESVFTRFADGFDKKIISHCALPGRAPAPAPAPH